MLYFTSIYIRYCVNIYMMVLVGIQWKWTYIYIYTCYLATCVLPLINNGDYGDNCSEGQTIDLDEVCIVVCDPNYQESVQSVECIIAVLIFLGVCTLPPIQNGNYGDCSEGQVIELSKTCSVVCDPNFKESVSSVECISAGNLDDLPSCTGEPR